MNRDFFVSDNAVQRNSDVILCFLRKMVLQNKQSRLWPQRNAVKRGIKTHSCHVVEHRINFQQGEYSFHPKSQCNTNCNNNNNNNNNCKSNGQVITHV